MSAKRKEAQTPIKNEATEKVKRFFSVERAAKNPSDHWQGYQIEILELKGEKIFKRYKYDKPDTKQVVMAKLELINDPDNQEYGDDGEKFI